PSSTYCPAPCRGILWLTPTFLGCLRSCSTSCFASLILVFRSACSFSEALCLGTNVSIFFRHARRSSAVWAFLYSASASRSWGVRLAAIVSGPSSLVLCPWFLVVAEPARSLYSGQGLLYSGRERARDKGRRTKDQGHARAVRPDPGSEAGGRGALEGEAAGRHHPGHRPEQAGRGCPGRRRHA